jgi:hypothetical protein
MYLKETQATPRRTSIFFTGGLSAPDEAEDELGRVQARLGAAECLGKIAICITNFIFDLRHPERRRAPLPPFKSASTKEKLLIQEWVRIRDNVVLPWIQRQRRSEQIEVAADKRTLCESILGNLQELESWVTIVSDPTRITPPSDRAKEVEMLKRAIGRMVGDLKVSFELYSAMGCTTPDLSSAKARVEKMPWPKDQAMQDQRTKLLQAIQRAQQS